jgi:hypothetical protein
MLAGAFVLQNERSPESRLRGLAYSQFFIAFVAYRNSITAAWLIYPIWFILLNNRRNRMNRAALFEHPRRIRR